MHHLSMENMPRMPCDAPRNFSCRADASADGAARCTYQIAKNGSKVPYTVRHSAIKYNRGAGPRLSPIAKVRSKSLHVGRS